jgi:hypothetical protein
MAVAWSRLRHLYCSLVGFRRRAALLWRLSAGNSKVWTPAKAGTTGAEVSEMRRSTICITHIRDILTVLFRCVGPACTWQASSQQLTNTQLTQPPLRRRSLAVDPGQSRSDATPLICSATVATSIPAYRCSWGFRQCALLGQVHCAIADVCCGPVLGGAAA